MQFKVPQFIDVEDKLFGPFTFHEFTYLVGGGGIIFVVYKLLPLWIGIFIIVPVAAFTAALVFYKINNKPFIYYVQAALNYGIESKLYIWKQRLVKPGSQDDIAPQKTSMVPMNSSSTLKDRSWSLDVAENDKKDDTILK
jgi:PrgI family protein